MVLVSEGVVLFVEVVVAVVFDAAVILHYISSRRCNRCSDGNSSSSSVIKIL